RGVARFRGAGRARETWLRKETRGVVVPMKYSCLAQCDSVRGRTGRQSIRALAPFRGQGRARETWLCKETPRAVFPGVGGTQRTVYANAPKYPTPHSAARWPRER